MSSESRAFVMLNLFQHLINVELKRMFNDFGFASTGRCQRVNCRHHCSTRQKKARESLTTKNRLEFGGFLYSMGKFLNFLSAYVLHFISASTMSSLHSAEHLHLQVSLYQKSAMPNLQILCRCVKTTHPTN